MLEAADGDVVLPAGLIHVRTTDQFDEQHHPAGILRAHRVAAGVWARLVVGSGALDFVFEDRPDVARTVGAAEAVVIPPGRLHHVEITGPVTFVLEFHRIATEPAPAPGTESTGLTAS